MRHVVALLLLLAVAVATWHPVLDGEFLSDDYEVLRIVEDLVDVERGLDLDNLGRLFGCYLEHPTQRFKLARPSVLVSFGLNLLTTGTAARPFFVTNLVLFLVSVVLLYALIGRLVPDAGVWAQTVGAAFFLVSPLQAEPLAWTAARSDLIALGCGLAALLAATRGRFIAALAFVTLSLTAKESALVFVAATWVLLSFGGDATSRRRIVATVACAALAVAYLVWRRYLIGQDVLDTAYASRSFSDYIAAGEALPRYGWSLWRTLAPVSPLVIDGPIPRALAGAALAAATLFFLGRGAAAAPRRATVAALLLIVVPFGLAVLVNEITAVLINSRAVHTSLAGGGLLFAAALAKARRPYVHGGTAAALIVALALLAHRGAELYEETSTRIGRTLGVFREFLDDPEHVDVRGLAILGFANDRYFADSFGLDRAFVRALQPPFYRPERFVALIADPRQFLALTSQPNDGTAFFDLGVVDGTRVGRLLTRGRFSRVPDGTIDPVSPPLGAVHRLDPAVPESYRPEFRWWTKGLASKRFVFGLTSAMTGLIDTELPLDLVQVAAAGEGREFTFALPAEIVRANTAELKGRELLGWYVRVLDADGRTLADTGLRLLQIEN